MRIDEEGIIESQGNARYIAFDYTESAEDITKDITKYANDLVSN